MCCAAELSFRHAVVRWCRACSPGGDALGSRAGWLYQATLVMFWLAVGLPGIGVK
jgi:hypothetical protein